MLPQPATAHAAVPTQSIAAKIPQANAAAPTSADEDFGKGTPALTKLIIIRDIAVVEPGLPDNLHVKNVVTLPRIRQGSPSIVRPAPTLVCVKNYW
jgi:hypothetical protein